MKGPFKCIVIFGLACQLFDKLTAQGQVNTTSTTTGYPETTELSRDTTTNANGEPQPPIFPEDDNSPELNGTDPVIIYGERAQAGEIPWQAYLFSQNQGQNTGSLCGGSLIRPTWVLTAAHCITDTSNTLVQLGSTNRNNMPYRQSANLRLYHENYNPNTLINDVALLRLPVAPTMSRTIRVIPLAPAGWTDLNRVPVRASGFGLTTNMGQSSDNLLKVNLVGVSNQECRNTYGNSIIDSTLCAAWTTRSGQSPCNGDSGGPLTAVSGNQHYLVGVVSFVVRNQCDSGRPSGYARVTSFTNWINSNIQRNS